MSEVKKDQECKVGPDGFCTICGAAADFVKWEWTPDYEGHECPLCGRTDYHWDYDKELWKKYVEKRNARYA